MNNDDLVLKMILDESGFNAGLNSAVKKLGDFDGKVSETGGRGGRSLGGIWDSFVGNFLASGATKIISAGFGVIQDSISGAINRVDTLNNSNRVFENMGFTATETAQTMDSLKESIQGLPTPLDSAIQGVQLIASSTEDLKKSEEIFSALNNGILGFGGSAEQVDNAVIQLSQSFSNGRVDAQTWNSMINSQLGPALSALAKQMGLTTGELKDGLSSGQISVEEFQDALITLNKEGGGGLKSLEQIAQDSTAGIETGIANAKTAVVRGMANVITSIDDSLKDAGFGGIGQVIANVGSAFENGLTKFAEKIPVIVQAFKYIYDTVKPFIPLLAGVASGFVALNVVDGIPKKINALKNSFTGLSSAFSLIAAHPIVFVFSAIAGTIIYLWTTNEDFRNFFINMWEGLKEFVSGLPDFFTGVWNAVKDTTENIWNGIKDFFSNLGTSISQGASDLWNGIVDVATGAVDAVTDAWEGLKRWFSDLWEGIKQITVDIWDSITASASDLKDGVMSYIGPLVYGIRNAFQHMQIFLSNLWGELVNVGKNYFEILKNVILAPVLFVTSMITGGWEEASDNMVAIWGNITEAAGNIWESITAIIENFTLNAQMAVLNVWLGIKNTLSNIWTGISDLATTIWTGISTYLTEVWDNLKDYSNRTWNNAKDGAIDSWEATKKGASEKWGAIKTFFSETWDYLKTGTVQTWDNIKQTTIDKWEAIKQFFGDTVSGMVTSAQNAWDDLKQGVSDVVGSVTDIFYSLKDVDLFQIGKDIIQGLIDGIGGMINAVKDSITGVADTIKNSITGALDIHSPSRWAKRVVGHNIDYGIADGIEEKTGEVKASMIKIADTIKKEEMPALSVATDISASPYTKEMKPTTQSVGKTSTEGSGNDTFNIYVQTLGDLPESTLMKLGQQLAKYIEAARQRDIAPKGGVFNGI